ncbi:hypothetical protein HDU99_002833 [Rhizoclosmatium hyalinum]|nr:hypothetical protein HDU99_002833 [Rhizoclosmatium hyalinum]
MATSAQDFLEQWHKVVGSQQINILDTLLSNDIVFNTPVYLKARKGKGLVKAILASAANIFQDFKYYNEWVSADGLNFCLEFGATIDSGKEGKVMGLKGVDIIRLQKESDGKLRIVHFEVMLRPINAAARFGELQAVGIPKMIQKYSPGAKL